jgi:hypothetical protein
LASGPPTGAGPPRFHHAAAQLQRDFLYAPAAIVGTGMRSKYRG